MKGGLTKKKGKEKKNDSGKSGTDGHSLEREKKYSFCQRRLGSSVFLPQAKCHIHFTCAYIYINCFYKKKEVSFAAGTFPISLPAGQCRSAVFPPLERLPPLC